MNDDTYQEVYQDESITVENLGGIDMGKDWEIGCTVNREDKMDCMCAKEDGKVAYKDESTQRYIDALLKKIDNKEDTNRKLLAKMDEFGSRIDLLKHECGALKKDLDEKNKIISEFEESLHRVNDVKDEEINRLKEENKKLEGLLSTAYSMFGELFELARKEK